jgi:hypothetical protein
MSAAGGVGARRAVAWSKDEPPGLEFAEITVAGRTMTAAGVAIGTAPRPYRLDSWVDVPALTVAPDGQRYRHLRSDVGQHVIGFEATDGSFEAEITVDDDGVVIAYPGIAQQVPAEGSRDQLR